MNSIPQPPLKVTDDRLLAPARFIVEGQSIGVDLGHAAFFRGGPVRFVSQAGLLQHMRDEGFIRAEADILLDVAKTVADVIPLYENRLVKVHPKVPLAEIKNKL